MMDYYNFNLAKALVDLFPNIGIDLAKFGKHVRAERGRAGAKKKRGREEGETEERWRRGRGEGEEREVLGSPYFFQIDTFISSRSLHI